MPAPASLTNNPLQVFTPAPGLAEKKTVAAGGSSQSFTVPAGAKAFMFTPLVPVAVRLNAESVGLRFSGSPDAPYGPFGIDNGAATVVFADTGTGGGDVIVSWMR